MLDLGPDFPPFVWLVEARGQSIVLGEDRRTQQQPDEDDDG
jgi:hypothetical protein